MDVDVERRLEQEVVIEGGLKPPSIRFFDGKNPASIDVSLCQIKSW